MYFNASVGISSQANMLQMNQTQQDLSTFRAALYTLAAEKAAKLNGRELMHLLKEVSEDVYTAGIDRALREAPIEDIDNLADAFDYTWLTLLIVRLDK